MAHPIKSLSGRASDAGKHSLPDGLGKGGLAQLTKDFYPVLEKYIPKKDQPVRTLETWNDIARDMVEFAQHRVVDDIKVHVFNAERSGQNDTTVIQISCDDFPYLVDTVFAELQRHGNGVKLSLYPEVGVRRNAQGVLEEIGGAKDTTRALEAWIHVETEETWAPEHLEKLTSDIHQALLHTRRVVEDTPACWEQMINVIAVLDEQSRILPHHHISEVQEFLKWCGQEHFMPLGYRQYSCTYSSDSVRFDVVPGRGLGLLRDDGLVLDEDRALNHPDPGTDGATLYRNQRVLVITKSTTRSTVEKYGRYDRVAVRLYNEDGNLVGAHLFIGHFTVLAHSRGAFDIPYVRGRAAYVLDQAGYLPGSHNYRAIIQILNSYPFEELLQTGRKPLLSNVLRIVELQERELTAVFLRYDAYRRFVSCLIYTPKNEFTNQTRLLLQTYLSEAFGGNFDSYSLYVDDSALVRIQIIINRNEAAPLQNVNLEDLEHHIQELCRSWPDRLRHALLKHFAGAAGTDYARRYGNAFSLSYQEAVTPEWALDDVLEIEKFLQEPLPIAIYFSERREQAENQLHLMFFHRDTPISLPTLLPMLENMGLSVLREQPHTCNVKGRDGTSHTLWLHDFVIGLPSTQYANILARANELTPTLLEIFLGILGDDHFNQLLINANLRGREVMLLRTTARYLMQVRLPFSQIYITETLVRHASLAQLFVHYFHTKFDPTLRLTQEQRLANLEVIGTNVQQELAAVASLDEDKILRRVFNVLECTLRTNYYQRGAHGPSKEYLSLKLDSKKLMDLPQPRPLYETFVYARRVEGIHLRSSKVARGGMRWSDRREDFRDEVLDLMKAQTVKNSVIVPSGAKGGFFVKRPPTDGNRAAYQAEGIECYKMLVRGMLDVTDNWVQGQIVKPGDVVCYDDDDPYLVVAADKGTASFSDLANGLSEEYNFWLGDAFASGGSAGYDHKKMGITARGAWESVRHHGYHLGIDVDHDPITVTGVGDMGGDVFGNGLLLSPHLKLMGAFSYSHIFCDPNPDPSVSFTERKRLFESAANWDQYNPKLLSHGGRIYSRTEKELELTPEIQSAFGITAEKLSPGELMRAILRAPVDLLWFGGIGTYIRASTEQDSDARDKANDFIRISADELRCKIIGEGANLGLTQRARIEAARRGAALNTDFIDNSAGVNSSDYEVNIKILFNQVMAVGGLERTERNKILVSMTEDIASKVLDNNQTQNTALGVAQTMSATRTEHFGRLIEELEHSTHLDRKLESLPTDAELRRMAAEHIGLTRPEISVVLSHTKLLLTHILSKDSMVHDPLLRPMLHDYFPPQMAQRYAAQIDQHPLKADLVAMLLSNRMVNQMSPYLPKWLMDRTGLGYVDIARAFCISSALFDFQQHWYDAAAAITLKPSVRQDLLIELLQHMDRTLPWILNQPDLVRDLSGTVARYRPHFDAIRDEIFALLPPQRLYHRDVHEQRLLAAGVPPAIATAHANLRSLAASPGVVALALELGQPVIDVARVYFIAGERFGLDMLREQARQSMGDEYWERQAISALIEDFSAHQLRLTQLVMVGPRDLAKWEAQEKQLVERLDDLMQELRSRPRASVTQLTVANRRLRGLVPGKDR